MPDYKGYDYASRWKADHWEIEVYAKKPDTHAIFQGTLHASEPTGPGTTLAHNVAEKVIDALTDHGPSFVLGSSTLDGPHKLR